MPVISRSVLAAVEVRQYAARIEDCHTDVLTVIPVTDVLHARSQRQGQASGRSPCIGHKERGCLVSSIGNGRRVVFTVGRQYAHGEVGGAITRAKLVVGKEIRIR